MEGLPVQTLYDTTNRRAAMNSIYHRGQLKQR